MSSSHDYRVNEDCTQLWQVGTPEGLRTQWKSVQSLTHLPGDCCSPIASVPIKLLSYLCSTVTTVTELRSPTAGQELPITPKAALW
jgi:hypothetical protein